MKILISIGLISIAFALQAQKSLVKYGDIPMDDMTMKQFDKDSSAAAVVLVDYGNAFIEDQAGEIVLTYMRHVRIKILKKDGLSMADASISLFHTTSSDERVTAIKASTYNLENGTIVESKLSKDGIFKEKFNRNYNVQKFTLPNAKVGSIIEYTYKVTSEFFTNFPSWQFQRSVPVRYSEYWAIIPDVFIYEKFMQGYIPVTTYETKSQNTAGIPTIAHHWISKNVPAFKEEPYMTCETDYVSKINFALASTNSNGVFREIMGSWEKLNSDLMENDDFGKVIAKSGFLKGKTEELTAGMTEPIQKISAIHDYVRNTIQWDGEEDFYAGNLKTIIEKKKGSSGDINLLLASMLDKAGLQVDMVLLSTRDHGFVRKQYPMTKQFNYVICAVKVGDKTMFLDATEKYLPMTTLPERCLNGEGLIISSTFKGWIDITSKVKAKTVISADFTIDEAGELKGKVTYIHDGYDAQEMRDKYSKKGEETYLKDFVSSKSWGIDKTTFEDLKDVGKPVKEIHEVTISEHGSASGDVIYINPFVTSQMQENPFKLEQRVYPVNFGRMEEKLYLFKVTLPEGYAVDELPAPAAIALPGNAGRYSYSIVQNANTINFTSNFQINKTLFIQDEYPALREFFNKVIAKQAEQIVLKKK